MYTILRDNDSIQSGDEWYNPFFKSWSYQIGWTNKKAKILMKAIGEGGKVRRKIDKKVIHLGWK